MDACGHGSRFAGFVVHVRWKHIAVRRCRISSHEHFGLCTLIRPPTLPSRLACVSPLESLHRVRAAEAGLARPRAPL